MASDRELLGQLLTYADSSVMGEFEQIKLAPPDIETAWLGILNGSTLELYERVQLDAASETTTLSQVHIKDGDKLKPRDLGTVMPSGVYAIPAQTLPNAKSPTGASVFPFFLVDRDNGATQLLRPAGAVVVSDPPIGDLLTGRGMLFYNNTPHPEPRLAFLTFEPTERDSWEWRFIDLCASKALQALSNSKWHLLDLKSIASSRPLPVEFTRMVDELHTKATLYHALELLRDELNVISYLRYLWYLPGFVVAKMLGMDKALEDRLARIVLELVPAIEANLDDASQQLSLDDVVRKIDERLALMREKAPLLGRLPWADARLLDAEGLAKVVVKLVDDLLEDNERARRMTQQDQEAVRALFMIKPPRVMGLPRIVQEVEADEELLIYNIVEYFFAVFHLKQNAAAFPFLLGFGQLVFAFFCPPAALALGFFQAGVSVDEALYKDALSDADISIDKTLVSQAEAREAAFWAAVDVIFAMIDAGAFAEVAEAVGEIRAAGKLRDLGSVTDEVAQLGAKAGDDLREVQRLTSAANAKSVQAPAGTVPEQVDLAKARELSAEARKGKVDLDPNNAPRLDNPPATADDAINEARDADPEVWQRLEGRGKIKGRKTRVNAREQIEKEYRAHFDEVMKARAEAAKKGLPLPPGPENPKHFGLRRYQEMLDLRVKQIDSPARAAYYEGLATSQKKTVGGLLSDEGRDALREALVNRVKAAKKSATGLDGFDAAFVQKFEAAVHRGESAAALDKVILDDFIKPIDDLAKRAGFAPQDGREFGLFAKGVSNADQWGDDALRNLRKLVEDTNVDRGTLHAMLTNPTYTEGIGSALLNEQLATALAKIKDVEGVMKPASLSGGRGMFYTLAKAPTRGTAFEALIVARLIDDVAAQGAKIVVGRRWWLQSIEKFNATLSKGSKAKLLNVLEADILIELKDGRRILFDAKFFDEGVVVSEQLADQITKIGAAIDEGLVHNAEYLASHHFVGELGGKGFSNLDAFQTHADLLSGGKIHIRYDVLEQSFPANFLESSRFTSVSRGDGITILIDDHLKIPATGPNELPPATPGTPGSLVPAPESLETIVPKATQANSIAQGATLRIVEKTRRSTIPIRPLGTAARVAVKAARMHDVSANPVQGFVILRGTSDSALSRTLADRFEAQPVEPALLARIQQDLENRRTCVMAGTPAKDFAEYACLNRSLTLRTTAKFRYALLAIRSGGSVAGEIRVQAVILDAVGRTLKVLPADNAVELRRGAAALIPFTSDLTDSPYAYPFEPGGYQWGVRLTSPGGSTTVLPVLLDMRVGVR